MNIETITDVERTSRPLHGLRTEPLRLQVFSSSERSAAMGLWREVEVQTSNRRLMCSSVWTDTWIRHYGSLVPHRFVIAKRGDQPCGAALLTSGVGQRAGPFQLRTWHIGTAGEPDSDSVCVEYNSVLARAEDRADFMRQLVDWANSRSDCDETRLDGFESAELAPLLLDKPRAIVLKKPSRYFDLSAARNANVEPMEMLGSRTRANLRRSMRQLGEPTGHWAETAEAAEEMLHKLIQRHQARWTALGEPGSYSSQRFREFHFDLVHQLVPIGAMGLYRVTTPVGVLGCAQVFIDDNRALLYQTGWSPQPGDASPGLIVDYMCMAACQQRGLDHFDFMAGESDYKRRLTTNTAELAWVSWRRPGLKSSVLEHLRRLKRVLSGNDRTLAVSPISAASTELRTE